ncbi:MAG TPA: UDP-N-acetylmuramoyl-L-alanine--D-glutamate ligase [Longilinea sp.]|nr:UDP-N-acetylmuramoyl-L-alanine--D-glutamate ligase [Longilinea sp.]
MSDWMNRRVLIVGAARQGQALGRALARWGAQVTLNDQRPAAELEPVRQAMEGLSVRLVGGGHPIDLLEKTDLVCLSGGVPLNNPLAVGAAERGIPVSNDTQIFMELVKAPVVGITGSAGKTTTTTLVGRMAKAGVVAPRKAWIGGNIGNPLIEHVEEIAENDLVVLELSSFQLEQMTISPSVSAVINITPNHLDRHGTMEAYTAAKARILDFQKPTDTAVLNRDDTGSWGLIEKVKGSLISFGAQSPKPGQAGTYQSADMLWFTNGKDSEEIMPKSWIELRGQHNVMNVLAASAIAMAAGLPVQAVQEGVRGFNGVPHRLELVREYNGARWYNDSIATAPERTMAAIRAFDEPLVLMLGGKDKNLPWEDLARLVHDRVDHVVVFGHAAEKILAALGPQSPNRKPYSLVHSQGLQQAVQAAAEVAQTGDVVLLSPGGTSFDEFKDFEERGESFRSWVNKLS